jgi:beta-lactamase class D
MKESMRTFEYINQDENRKTLQAKWRAWYDQELSSKVGDEGMKQVAYS